MSSQAFYEDKKGRDLMLSILTYHLAPRLVYYMYVISTTMYDTCVPENIRSCVYISDLQPSRVSSLVSGALELLLLRVERTVEASRSCCIVHSISERFTHGAYLDLGEILSYHQVRGACLPASHTHTPPQMAKA